MESSVSLQEPFSYAIWPIVAAGAVVLAALIYWIIVFIRKIFPTGLKSLL